MVKKFNSIFFCCIFFIVLHCYSQEPYKKYGNISFEELKLKSYNKDTTAGAVVLFDYGELNFSPTYGFIYIMHKRIKIFKKSFSDWGSVSIFIPEGDYVENIKAVAYNLNGNSIEKALLKKELIHSVSESNHSIKKFTIPDIQEGSVIEYYYEKVSPRSIRLSDWYFQSSIPVIWSELNFNKIPFSFGYEIQKFFPLAVDESDDRNRIFRWAMKDLPAFKDEDFIAYEPDCISKISFFPNPPSNIEEGWKDLVRGVKTKNGFFLSNSVNFLESYFKEIKSQAKDSIQLLANAYNFIKDHYSCDGKNSISCRPLKKVFDDKLGSASEINLTLCHLLKEFGFDAHPFILSTKDKGRISKYNYPSKYNFNLLLCVVNISGKNYFLDASDKLRPYFLPPLNALHCEGVVIDKKDINWYTVSSTELHSENYQTVFNLSEKGIISGNVKYINKGYSAWSIRKTIEERGEKEYLKHLSEEFKFATAENFSIENLKDIDKNIIVNFKITFEDTVNLGTSRYYINPKFFDKMEQNPLKLPFRYYPVDFEYPLESVYSLTFTIPPTYALESYPQNISLAISDNSAGFVRNVAIFSEGKIFNMVCRRYVKNTFYSTDAYLDLRQLFNEIMNKDNEDLILIRK